MVFSGSVFPGNVGFGGLTEERLGEVIVRYVVFCLPSNKGFGRQWNSWENSLCTMLCSVSLATRGLEDSGTVGRIHCAPCCVLSP